MEKEHAKRHQRHPPEPHTGATAEEKHAALLAQYKACHEEKEELRHSAEALLDVLRRMPWCRDHRPDCPANAAGPCTCGVNDLLAAKVALSALLGP